MTKLKQLQAAMKTRDDKINQLVDKYESIIYAITAGSWLSFENIGVRFIIKDTEQF